MNMIKRINLNIYFLRLLGLLSVLVLILTMFIYKPMQSVSVYKTNNNMLGSMVDNLNLTGLDDSSYEINHSYKVSTSDIFKYILRYSKNIGVDDARELSQLIKRECNKYKINPYLVLAIIKVESGFNPAAISSKGAIGLMQIMPETAFSLAAQKGLDIEDVMSFHDPLINVELGIYYFNKLYKRYSDVESALFAYNYGPGKFEVISRNINAVPAYVSKVIKFRDYLENISITKES